MHATRVFGKPKTSFPRKLMILDIVYGSYASVGHKLDESSDPFEDSKWRPSAPPSLPKQMLLKSFRSLSY